MAMHDEKTQRQMQSRSSSCPRLSVAVRPPRPSPPCRSRLLLIRHRDRIHSCSISQRLTKYDPPNISAVIDSARWRSLGNKCVVREIRLAAFDVIMSRRCHWREIRELRFLFVILQSRPVAAIHTGDVRTGRGHTDGLKWFFILSQYSETRALVPLLLV